MNTLSFRKESIQRSSHQSEAVSQMQDVPGSRAARDQRPITLTTTLTITQL